MPDEEEGIITETKAYDTAELAKENQYPLKITIEEIVE